VRNHEGRAVGLDINGMKTKLLCGKSSYEYVIQTEWTAIEVVISGIS